MTTQDGQAGMDDRRSAWPAGVPADLQIAPEESEFSKSAGLVLDAVGPTRVEGHIELGPAHHQPFGLVHGGVYCSAVETAASFGATVAAHEHGQVAVGVANTTNFLRSMRSGRVDVVAEALHQGRTQQLWEVRITDADHRLVALGQVRLQNVHPRPAS
jgi:1,4-dihydroxy-2-naphthoyl-CoA hydrolase